MKKTSITLICMLGLAQSLAAAVGISISKSDGETLQIAGSAIERMQFADGKAIVTGIDGTTLEVDCNLITSISHTPAVATAYGVTFSGTSATVVNPYALLGVTTEIDGAYVTTTNPNAAQELTFSLTGSSGDGGYTYNGEYKATLEINNLTLTSGVGGAVNIACGKRIAVNVVGTNNLTDFAEGSQKACLYFKGHPEFDGSGTLNLTGNLKHALSAKEYIQLKKKFGKINVLAAEGDAIHAGQYFQMNGGAVTIRNTKGDGIQAEFTNDPTDENNGHMIIKGGTIDISLTGDDSDCLKSDSTMTISGGTFILSSSGATAKGIKSKHDLNISDGTFNITMTGNGVVVEEAASTPPMAGPGGWGPGGGNWGQDQEDKETSAPGCVKSDGNLIITGGTFNLKATGKGGKCINSEGTGQIGAPETDGPTITAATSGAPVTGSGENINGLPKAIKVYGNLIIDSGNLTITTTQNGGEGIECKSALTINGGVISCATYDDGINSAVKVTVNGGVVFASASNNDGIDCNGSEGFEFNGGIVCASGSSSPEESFDCDNYKFKVTGGYLIGTGGSISSVTSATQPYATSTRQSITANQYINVTTADGTVICSYKVPKTLSSATLFASVPEFVKGTSYRIVRNTAAPTNPTATYLDGRFTMGGTITGGTSVTITPNTK